MLVHCTAVAKLLTYFSEAIYIYIYIKSFYVIFFNFVLLTILILENFLRFLLILIGLNAPVASRNPNIGVYQMVILNK